MLFYGKNRLYSLTGLAFLAVLAFLTLSYNPSLPEDSAHQLRKWAKISTEHPPVWYGAGRTEQETLPFNSDPQQDTSKLPSANPDPYAALGGSASLDKKPPTSYVEPAVNSPAPIEPAPVSPKPIEPAPVSPIAVVPAQEPPKPVVITKPESEKTELEKTLEYVKQHMGVPLNPHNHDHSIEGLDRQDIAKSYHEISSKMTKDGKYWHINMPPYAAYNPNLIPHPRLNNTWILTSQRLTIDRGWPSGWSDQIACEVKFDPLENNNLTCTHPPRMLPIAATTAPRDGCPEDISNLHMNIGPHDARVFYGPRFPYTVYGSQSQFKCFGQWTQDFRMLWDWGQFRNYSDPFDRQTEIQRPDGYNRMEKNYFFFWDFEDRFYAHYDTAPQRSYAMIMADGSSTGDIAPQARTHDAACWAKHLNLNPLPPKSEAKSSIHQATNSLSVTMCKRSDPTCTMTRENTFIIQIYQHKVGNGLMHARYEPYVMMFKRETPFQMHGISSKPVWIRGRSSKNEMIYATSINWKVKDLNYHGYLDDIIFMGFGVEDKRTAGIDVTAEELIGDLMPC